MSVPVLSWLLIACRTALASIAGPIHEQFLTSPTLAPRGHCQSSSDPPASSLSPTDPILRANPFPEVTDLFCRLPLPTLFYRPEAAHLGDLLRLWVRTDAKINLSLGFSRAFRSAPDTTRSVVLYRPLTISPGNQIPWCQVVNKKRELFPGLLPTSPSSVALPHVYLPKKAEYPRSGSGILTRFPFDLWPRIGHFETEFPYLLGSTNPCPTAVHMEPFSTSVFKVLIWIFATTTKIFTRGRFTQAHAKGCVTTPTPSYSLELRHLL